MGNTSPLLEVVFWNLGYNITYEDLKKMAEAKSKRYGLYDPEDEKGLQKINWFSNCDAVYLYLYVAYYAINKFFCKYCNLAIATQVLLRVSQLHTLNFALTSLQI